MFGRPAVFVGVSLLAAVARAGEVPAAPPDDLRRDMSRLDDALIDRCVRFLYERNQRWAQVAGSDGAPPHFLSMAARHDEWALAKKRFGFMYDPENSDLTQEETRICRVAGDGYFAIRATLLTTMLWARFPLGHSSNDEMASCDRLLREFEHDFGLQVVRKIEAHRDALWKAYHWFIDDPLMSAGDLLNSSSLDLALPPGERCRSAVQAVIDHLTSSEFLARYLQMRRRWAADPRVETTTAFGTWPIAQIASRIYFRPFDEQLSWSSVKWSSVLVRSGTANAG